MLKRDPQVQWHGLTAHSFVGLVCRDALKLRAKHLCIFFDGEAGFRYEIYPEYKAGRSAKVIGSTEISLYDALPMLLEVCDRLGLPYQQVESYEADDLFASFKYQYEPEAGDRVYICTHDKDMSQLIDETYSVFTPGNKTRADRYINLQNVGKYRYGLTPARYLDYQTLVGDATDNIPQIISPAKALKIIQAPDFGSLKQWMKTDEGQQLVRSRHPELVRNRMLVKLSKSAFDELPNITPKLPKSIPQRGAPGSYVSYYQFASSRTKSLF